MNIFANDQGLEQHFMEPDNPYEVRFKDLFTKDQEQWSLTEWNIYFTEWRKAKSELLRNGLLEFMELLQGDFLEVAPHLQPYVQKIFGTLTSREFKTIMLIFLDYYSENKVAAELNVSRRTVRTYKKRALEKIFKSLPEQATSPDEVCREDYISLIHNFSKFKEFVAQN